jgi:predicted enzyme related to lactoylglutathione lyase
MTIKLGAITLDCGDTVALANFWSVAIDRPLDPDPNEFVATIGMSDRADGAPGWLFVKVPEGKSAKNRMHCDFVAPDRAAEVDRLVALGATAVAEHDEWGHRWTVLQDPEGNEFCVAQEK